ncbi:MAG TPA: GWxTD domain-containing protein [Bacteroidia bacterium]|nr:GWxTD domain-containing protein [Bacteroidia bacterium]
MKKLLILSALLISGSLLHAREITANLTWCAFNTADNHPYVETYMSVVGNSVVYQKNTNGKYQASVDVFLTFTQDDSIKSVKRYILNSPELEDSSKAVTFLDLQRIPLPLGLYTLQITLTDLGRQPEKPVSNWKKVIVDMDPDSVCVSHLEMLESCTPTVTQNTLSKSGYDMVPYVSSFFPENMNELKFYGEVYNTTKVIHEDKFLVLYYIESAATMTKMNDYSSFLKLAPEKINSFIYSFNLTKLPSGSYNLVVEVRNAFNRLLSQRKSPFERFNPGITYQLTDLGAVDISNTFAGRITNIDTLTDYIRSLRPISSQPEIEFAENRIKAGDLKLMQQYFYNFWLARNETNPEGAWLKYNIEVQKVNHDFSTPILRGYETDRGRVYLQYGPPDQRVVETNEPSSYPYEIWQYYTIRSAQTTDGVNQPDNTVQTNKKFVFADFDLVTNNYQLIHSDARGEVRDDNWQLRLVKRDNAPGNVDDQQGTPQYGGNSNDWYKNPH